MYIQVSFLKRNSKKLLPSDLSQLSRGLAYECSLPKVDNWHADQVRCYPNQQEALNPYIVTSLPGKSQLQEWRRAIDKQDTTQWKYMETSKGRLDIDCLNQLTRFHTGRNIQAAVEEEIQWFARPFNKPEIAVEHSTASSISSFQNFLYCKRYDEISKPYGLSSDELSKLCTDRWVSSDHVCWLMANLNQIQVITYFVYLNGRNQLPTSQRRFTHGKVKPSKFCFAMVEIKKVKHILEMIAILETTGPCAMLTQLKKNIYIGIH